MPWPPARCVTGRSHLPATGDSPPPWHPPHTVADVSPPRNGDEQADTGTCLVPLIGWGPSRTTAPSQRPGAVGCEAGARSRLPGSTLLHGGGSIVITASLSEPTPTHPRHCESSLCGRGAGRPHKHLWQLVWGGKQGYEGALENGGCQPGAGRHHSGMGRVGVSAQQQPVIDLWIPTAPQRSGSLSSHL